LHKDSKRSLQQPEGSEGDQQHYQNMETVIDPYYIGRKRSSKY